MSKPIVAIVGRPNVGKSTLFNRISRSRIAIVEGTPGVTRDRIYSDAEWLNRHFTLVDTGGIDYETDEITKQVRRQAMIAVEQADVIIFVVDGRTGITALDEELAEHLRRSGKPIVLCVNKVDDQEQAWELMGEFYALGLGDPLLVSAEHGKNVGDLLDKVIEYLPEDTPEPSPDALHVAIVGRPNVGKSSLVNKILGDDRCIVTDIAGTTRDAVDSWFTYGEQEMVLIDTAGLRRRSKVEESLEYYSVMRTLRAVDRSNVTVAVLDATEGLTEQDTKIIGYAHESGRGLVIAVNKWDLVEKDANTLRNYELEIRKKLRFADYAPIVFISALTGQRVRVLLDTIIQVNEARGMRIPTGRLNEIIQDAVQVAQVPSDKGVQLKIYYATQVQVNPPVFAIYVNRRDLMHWSYQRYLENRLRQEYGFVGTPIVLAVKERNP